MRRLYQFRKHCPSRDDRRYTCKKRESNKAIAAKTKKCESKTVEVKTMSEKIRDYFANLDASQGY